MSVEGLEAGFNTMQASEKSIDALIQDIYEWEQQYLDTDTDVSDVAGINVMSFTDVDPTSAAGALVVDQAMQDLTTLNQTSASLISTMNKIRTTVKDANQG